MYKTRESWDICIERRLLYPSYCTAIICAGTMRIRNRIKGYLTLGATDIVMMCSFHFRSVIAPTSGVTKGGAFQHCCAAISTPVVYIKLWYYTDIQARYSRRSHFQRYDQKPCQTQTSICHRSLGQPLEPTSSSSSRPRAKFGHGKNSGRMDQWCRSRLANDGDVSTRCLPEDSRSSEFQRWPDVWRHPPRLHPALGKLH